MAQVRARSPSPSSTPTSDTLQKRLKTSHPPSADEPTNIASRFHPGLLETDAANLQKLKTTYATNEPFKYAVIDKLFQDDLLKNVKDECINHLSFSEKETDIYKVSAKSRLDSNANEMSMLILIRYLSGRSTKQATSPHSPISPQTNSPSSQTSSPSAMPSTHPNSARISRA
jgi:hypothetical protein